MSNLALPAPSRLPFHLVNAFTTGSPHTGNQAAVVLFDSPRDPRAQDSEWMRLVARDFNYAETAYLVPHDAAASDPKRAVVRYGLRWFTPEVEVPLCGHATLAASFTVFSLYPSATRIEFATKSSGTLVALGTPSGGVSISLPVITSPSLATPASKATQEAIVSATGLTAEDVVEITPYEFAGKSMIVQIAPRVDLAALKVDARAIAALAEGLFILTQVNSPDEISSRVFAPGLGIDEDPVTGAAHAVLTPYHLSRAAFLGARDAEQVTLTARQLSARGGRMTCRLDQGRVELVGSCAEFGRGEMRV